MSINLEGTSAKGFSLVGEHLYAMTLRGNTTYAKRQTNNLSICMDANKDTGAVDEKDNALRAFWNLCREKYMFRANHKGTKTIRKSTGTAKIRKTIASDTFKGPLKNP